MEHQRDRLEASKKLVAGRRRAAHYALASFGRLRSQPADAGSGRIAGTPVPGTGGDGARRTGLAVAARNPTGEASSIAERYDGRGVFTTAQFRRIVLAYEHEFQKPLPVSARGATALHRSLDSINRDRVDVALHPDQKEGAWLCRYLEFERIPYFAFRRSIPGISTAAHIHIGPPSGRYRLATESLCPIQDCASLFRLTRSTTVSWKWAAQIDADYASDGPIHMIGILKGAVVFLADLARAGPQATRIDFIGISSYGRGKTTSGEVKTYQGPRRFHRRCEMSCG